MCTFDVSGQQPFVSDALKSHAYEILLHFKDLPMIGVSLTTNSAHQQWSM